MVIGFFKGWACLLATLSAPNCLLAIWDNMRRNPEYFVYEADEFDRNFLAFEPEISLITGVAGIIMKSSYPRRLPGFKEFIDQTKHTFMWMEDAEYLGCDPISKQNAMFSIALIGTSVRISLKGKYNQSRRLAGRQAVRSISKAA